MFDDLRELGQKANVALPKNIVATPRLSLIRLTELLPQIIKVKDIVGSDMVVAAHSKLRPY
jgi:hypothetical protein